MLEIFEDTQAVFDDFVRFPVVDVRDEADAAGIMLVPGVIEALRRRKARSVSHGRSGGGSFQLRRACPRLADVCPHFRHFFPSLT